MLNDTFILNGKTAETLYNEFAKDAAIYDCHCHLTAKEIYENKSFEDISSLWLKYDHYKWRAMRYAGVPEALITGEADGIAKFMAWAKTCQRLIGSPLYHWASMELKTYFGINVHLNEFNAKEVYNTCSEKIIEDALSPIKIIQKSNVKLICTTDDPIDSLEYHDLLRKQNLSFKVLPTFRPDKALNIRADGYLDYVYLLSKSNESTITNYTEFIEALISRIEYFAKAGCLLSDHSIESLSSIAITRVQAKDIFDRRLSGKKITSEEAEIFRIQTLILLASEYKKVGWVMQLHIGALRNINDVMFSKLGVDSGFDIMNDFRVNEPLSKIFNAINNKDGLPKTILYTLNSKDNLLLSSLPHCFPDDGVVGKIQFGPAWWFNDNKMGILSHLKFIANQGMLADFIGMLTDSRSFLSYVRHDYFRRVLCSYIGELVDSGEFENNYDILKEIIEGICYKNIKSYLGIDMP